MNEKEPAMTAADPEAAAFPFLNPDRPLEERIADLIGRMTLAEKCSQLRYNAPAIERLGVPAYNWWNEALHGVARNGRATVFPQAINLAATWDAALVERVAGAVADEARAKHHAAVRRGARGQYQGLTFWSPNVNIFRDPRWGRGQETWGEDPFLTGELGAAYVRGLQGDDPKYLKTAACAKHYAVHSGPEALRHEFDARPSPRDLWETYLPAFRRLVAEGVESVMGAYNRVYGEPCCGSPFLLEELLRRRWGFQGHVVSDCGAIRDFHQHHKVTRTPEESAALALKSGCDLNCGSVYCDALEGAVLLGLCAEADVDRALRRLLRTRFRLGLFDPPERVPFAATPMSVVRCARHTRLARAAAAASIVLLKNRGGALPIPPGVRKIALVGPHAANADVLLGNYYGVSDRLVTLVEGVAARLPEGAGLEYRFGCPPDRAKLNDMDWSLGEAAGSDYAIAALGLCPAMEGEEGESVLARARGDRERVELPEHQAAYARALRERIEQRPGAKLIVVLFGGSPMAAPEIHELADAVLWAGYPGEAGGAAIADVLFGDAAPGGRLPFTVPRSTEVLPPFEDYSLRGRTYKYMDEAHVLYPFGFGLTYAVFRYGAPRLAASVGPDAPLRVRVPVTNAGDRAADEVVQAYVRREDDAAGAPRFRLAAFRRVRVGPGATRMVRLTIPPAARERISEAGEAVRAPGRFRLWIGGAAPMPVAAALGAAAPVEAEFRVR